MENLSISHIIEQLEYLNLSSYTATPKSAIIFDNEYVVSKIKSNKNGKNIKIINELKQITPSLDDDKILELYNRSISLHQSKMQNNGYFLENNILLNILKLNNVSYKKQVSVDKMGIIVGFDGKKKKCYHIIDFVIGDNIEIGKSLINYKVISCKTTCRERWTQDNWSFTIIPKLYILVTISNDYPSSQRFRENTKRKIVTCNPKKRDDRIYKLRFEDLSNELL